MIRHIFQDSLLRLRQNPHASENRNASENRSDYTPRAAGSLQVFEITLHSLIQYLKGLSSLSVKAYAFHAVKTLTASSMDAYKGSAL
jgi:hypothetical protein